MVMMTARRTPFSCDVGYFRGVRELVDAVGEENFGFIRHEYSAFHQKSEHQAQI